MLRLLVITAFLMPGTFSTAAAQDSDSPNKNLDVRSPVGDLHLGNDADAKKVGIPLYPGARLKSHDENSDQANLSMLTEAFGMKLLVANYVSDDDPAKIVELDRKSTRLNSSHRTQPRIPPS